MDHISFDFFYFSLMRDRRFDRFFSFVFSSMDLGLFEFQYYWKEWYTHYSAFWGWTNIRNRKRWILIQSKNSRTGYKLFFDAHTHNVLSVYFHVIQKQKMSSNSCPVYIVTIKAYLNMHCLIGHKRIIMNEMLSIWTIMFQA